MTDPTPPLPRLDDWSNTTTSLGSVRDKSTGRRFAVRPRRGRKELEGLYEQSAIAARVVDKLPDDAFREGWAFDTIVGPGDQILDGAEIKERIEDEIHLSETFRQAAKWGNLYGASLVLIPTEDDAPPKEGLGQVSRVHNLGIVPAHLAQPLDYDEVFGSPTFQQVLRYQVDSFTRPLELHRSRVVKFEPIELPPTSLADSGYFWGPSVLDRLWDSLSRAGEARGYSVGMMYLSSILFVKLHHYRQQHLSKQGREQIQTFLATVRRNLDSLGIMGLDKEDDLGVLTRTMTGVHELIDQLDVDLAASSPMPKEIMFNESPAGLNAGQLTGPQELWHGTVKAEQTRTFTPKIRKVLDILFRSDAWKGLGIKSYEIKWLPLWTKSDELQAETELKNAQADDLRVKQGAASGSEVRQHRLVEGRQDPLQVAAEKPPEALDLSITEDDVGAAEAAEVPTPADQAMNGAQITALVAIAEQVAAGTLPRASAVAIVRAGFPTVAPLADVIVPAEPPPLPAAPAAPGVGTPVAGGEDAAEELQQAPHAPPPGEPLLTPAQIREQLGVSPSSLRTMHKSGQISGWQFNGRWKYVASEILQAAHRPKVDPNAEPEEPEDDGA